VFLELGLFTFAIPNEFLGACIVEATDSIHAVLETHNLGINPGGECVIVPFPPEHEWDDKVRAFVATRDKLLSKEDLLAIDPNSKSEADLKREKMN